MERPDMLYSEARNLAEEHGRIVYKRSVNRNFLKIEEDSRILLNAYREINEQVKGKQEDGTLAGSIINLMDAVKNAMNFAGLSLEDAVAMATINPAKVLGLYDRIGSIEPGKRADLVVLDEDLEVNMVFCRGSRVK
jgi:N-acetylglucosamine-6-phosphate deacetylase